MPNKSNAITSSGNPAAIRSMHRDAIAMMADASARGLDTAPGAWEQSREQAAHHETGHAIVNAARGTPVTKLAIYRVDGHWCGWCSSPDPGHLLNIASDLHTDWLCAENTIAGLAGELVSGTYTHGSCVDEIVKTRQIAALMAEKIGEPFPRVMNGIIQSAVHTIRHNRATFDALARRLHRQRKVKGPALRRYLRAVEPYPETP